MPQTTKTVNNIEISTTTVFDLAYRRCTRRHSRRKAILCEVCQDFVYDFWKVLSEIELDLAKQAISWFEAHCKGVVVEPDFIKMARKCTKYPGQYKTITLLPGWVVRNWIWIALIIWIMAL